MIIYPAIDMLGGKCVRLTQGDYDKSTVYGDRPADMAKKWESLGATFIHTVDLDGARAGKPVNIEAIKELRGSQRRGSCLFCQPQEEALQALP